jgi:hypothetical protein
MDEAASAKPEPAPWPLTAAELAGLLRLASAGVVAVSAQAEDLQLRITRPLPFAFGDAITRGVYGAVRGAATLVDQIAQRASAKWPTMRVDAPDSARERYLSVLNGVCGDHLMATRNPLAITMQLRGERTAGARYAVFVHGLCLGDSHWRDSRDSPLDAMRTLGDQPLFLRYNSGAAIADNGAQFATMLTELATTASAIVVIAHSMGGLVTRVAIDTLHRERRRAALARLKAVVYLGTPHAGAPLERAGHWIETIWRELPYAGALAPIARLRSRGILDLRAGLVEPKARRRNYAEFAIAGRLPSRLDSLLGDGLVPVASALKPAHIPLDQQRMLDGIGHLELLHAPAIGAQLKAWLAPQAP